MNRNPIIPAVTLLLVQSMVLASCDSDRGLCPDQNVAAYDGICFGVSDDIHESSHSMESVTRPCVTDSLVARSAESADSMVVAVAVTSGIDRQSARSRGVPATFLRDFSVYAFYYRDGGAETASHFYFENETVTYSYESGLWLTATKYFWPTDAGSRLSFWALAGGSQVEESLTVTPSATNPEDMRIDYVVPDDAKHQPDLMLATTGRANGHGEPGYAQPLEFSHLCAAVRFEVGSHMQAGTVRSIVLSGVMSSGSYTTRWTGLSRPADFEMSPGYVSSGDDEPGSAINSPDNTFMMIPQRLGADAKLSIVFEDSYGAVRTLVAPLGGQKWEQGTTTYKI